MISGWTFAVSTTLRGLGVLAFVLLLDLGQLDQERLGLSESGKSRQALAQRASRLGEPPNRPW